MAKNAPTLGMPLDTPISIAPGVMHRETDWQGSAKFGIVQGLFNALGMSKGNVGYENLPPPRPLFNGKPYRLNGAK